MISIQYVSDLHIDQYPEGTPFVTFARPVAPILVIAGDICPIEHPFYKEFLAWCSQHWHTVILITGNHEYFCQPGQIQTFDEIDRQIRQLCHQLGIHFLQAGESYRVPGTKIRFVGATLWSAIDPNIWSRIQNTKGEFTHTFQRTATGIRYTTPSDICAFHAHHATKLYTALVPEDPQEVLIVVTHHMPTRKLLEPRYHAHPLRSCYASHDDALFAPNVHIWICGHGHRATQYQSETGPLVCMNARGYPNEVQRRHDRFDPQMTITLPHIVKN